jgi:hypothetical protein
MAPRFGWRIVAAFLPLAVGGLGLYNNFSDWRAAQTRGQHIAAAGVVLYGPIGVAAGIALLVGHRIGRTLLIAFSALTVLVGTIAPVAWGGAPWFTAIFSFFGSAVLCAAAIWAASMAFPAADPDPNPAS